MLKPVYTYFTSPEFDALRRAASTGQSKRTDPTENSAKSQPEAEEGTEAIVEEII